MKTDEAPFVARDSDRACALLSCVCLLAMSAVPALAQHQPYAGQEHREIKALSAEEVEGLLAGKGLGMARAAELNHLPGPKHVLELADELHLSEAQRRTASAIYDAMAVDARRLGGEIVEAEEGLDIGFSTDTRDPEALRQTVAEIAELRGELRWVHLRAHLLMVDELLPGQVARYDRLRGYAAHGSEHETCPHRDGSMTPQGKGGSGDPRYNGEHP